MVTVVDVLIATLPACKVMFAKPPDDSTSKNKFLLVTLGFCCSNKEIKKMIMVVKTSTKASEIKFLVRSGKFENMDSSSRSRHGIIPAQATPSLGAPVISFCQLLLLMTILQVSVPVWVGLDAVR